MNTPTLDAIESALADALDDSPGAGSDLTPPVGAILAAIGPHVKGERERPIRDTENPWVCSVWFEGEKAPVYLVGNAGLSGAGCLRFTSKQREAMSAHTRNWFTFGWPFLIQSHAREIGKRPVAIVHRLKESPDWSGTAAEKWNKA